MIGENSLERSIYTEGVRRLYIEVVKPAVKECCPRSRVLSRILSAKCSPQTNGIGITREMVRKAGSTPDLQIPF